MVRYLVEQCDLEAGELFEVDVGEAQRHLPRDALEQLLEVAAVGQRQGVGVVLHLDAAFLRRLLAHRRNQTVRLDLGLPEDNRVQSEKKKQTKNKQEPNREQLIQANTSLTSTSVGP